MNRLMQELREMARLLLNVRNQGSTNSISDSGETLEPIDTSSSSQVGLNENYLFIGIFAMVIITVAMRYMGGRDKNKEKSKL
jgi:hypothetical protein